MKIRKDNTQLKRTPTEAGESIEEMLRRLTANKEPIPQNVPPIFTAKADGIIADYDIRHDRWDTAYYATDQWAKSEIAKSAQKGESSETADDDSAA